MSSATHLDALAGKALTATEKSSTLAAAHAFFGTTSGDSEDEDLGTAMLAFSIGMNRRKAEKAKTDGSITVLSIEELVTPEMERLVNKTNLKTSMSFFIKHQQLSSNKHWSS